MHEADKQRIIQRYNERIKNVGLSFEALSSGTEERRKKRFDILTEIGITDADEVLDLGCGFGDYSNYLEQRRLKVNYTGYDINSTLIDEAKRRYPDKKFFVRDIIKEDFQEFDYIVSSSCFNLPLISQNNYDFTKELLEICYKHARKGVSVDFLTSYVDFYSEEGFHYEPEKIFAIAKKITKRVCLRHDYPLFEFNIYLYKDFEGWGKNA